MEIQEMERKIDFSTETEEKKVEINFENVAVVLVKTGLDFSLCGKSLSDFVKLATSPCKVYEINDVAEENLLRAIRPYSEGAETVVVLYGDTPLLTKATFVEILERFAGRNAMRLPRGWVFKGEFVRSAYMLMSTAVENFGREDFYVVHDAMTLSYAFKVINKRILSYHKKNGVFFFGEETIFVDADVEIEEGAHIYANNVLRGKTYVGRGAVLDCGNVLEDTIVCDEAKVTLSHLQNCKVESGKTVPPFTCAEGQVF